MNRIINLVTRHTYANLEIYFRTPVIGSSDCNDFVPVHAIGMHQLIEFEDGTKVLEYKMPLADENRRTGTIRQYDRLLMGLKDSETPVTYIYKLGDVEYTFYLIKGMLYDSVGNILFCLGINTEYLLNTPIRDILETPNSSKFTLFISNLFLEPIYKNIYKKLSIEYISVCKNLDIDVIETSKINDWLFSNNFVPPKFKTVSGMKKHLQEIPSLILKE